MKKRTTKNSGIRKGGGYSNITREGIQDTTSGYKTID